MNLEDTVPFRCLAENQGHLRSLVDIIPDEKLVGRASPDGRAAAHELSQSRPLAEIVEAAAFRDGIGSLPVHYHADP